MYDINKLQEIASMFNVEVSLYGEDQDKLQMIGTNGDINKFFEEAKRQGLLGKDPFDESLSTNETKIKSFINKWFNENIKSFDLEPFKQDYEGYHQGYEKVMTEVLDKLEPALFASGLVSEEEYWGDRIDETPMGRFIYNIVEDKLVRKCFDESYNPEETSWMDALIDVLRTYPSNDEIENDPFLKELRELYYKHYPDSDKIIEEETLMERMDFDTLYQKVKAQDRPIHEGFFGTLLFDTSFAHELYDEFYRPLTDLIKKGDKEAALKEYNELAAELEELANKKYAKTFVAVQRKRLTEYKDQIDAMEDAKVEEPALVESLQNKDFDIEGFTYTITDTFEDEGVIGHNIIYSKDGIDIVEAEIWEEPSPIMIISNLHTPNLMEKTYDDFQSFAIDLKYKVSRYIKESITENKKEYKPHTKRLLKLIGSDKLDEEVIEEAAKPSPAKLHIEEMVKDEFESGHRLCYDYDDFKEGMKEDGFRGTSALWDYYQELRELGPAGFYEEFKDKFEFDSMFVSEYGGEEDEEYDDYEESYTPISEDIDDEYEVPSYKAENTEFVMKEYISDSYGVESINKVNDTTYKILYDGTEVEIIFDFGWDEWVYTINGKGPFAHSSYEWIISDIQNVIDDEPIQESYFEDEPSWLDEDPVDADREHANLYGGDRTYCDTCGSKLAMDEWGSYCPKCNPPELEEGFDTHSDIDLDMVGVRVANLLDVEALGEDNWIEFDCKETRALTGAPELHMAFEVTGANKMLRGYMRARTDGTISVYIKNGSEGEFRNAEEIARFIAGEFGISI